MESVDKVEILISCESSSLIPQYSHSTDAGCDLKSSVDLIIYPGEQMPIPTGIRISMPDNYVGYVLPRSGVSTRTDLRVITGVIDSGYHGEIKVMIENTTRSNDTNIYDLEGNKVEGLSAEGRAYHVGVGDLAFENLKFLTPATTAVCAVRVTRASRGAAAEK